jgi:hypothetical protein
MDRRRAVASSFDKLRMRKGAPNAPGVSIVRCLAA